jgi:hypothetical protein
VNTDISEQARDVFCKKAVCGLHAIAAERISIRFDVRAGWRTAGWLAGRLLLLQPFKKF